MERWRDGEIERWRDGEREGFVSEWKEERKDEWMVYISIYYTLFPNCVLNFIFYE